MFRCSVFTSNKTLGIGGMMELHRLQDLPDRLDEPHPDLGQSGGLASVEAAGVLTDNIMEQHVTLENH